MRKVSRCSSSPRQLYTELQCTLKVIDRGSQQNQMICMEQRLNSGGLLSRTHSWPWLHLKIPTMKTENRGGDRRRARGVQHPPGEHSRRGREYSCHCVHTDRTKMVGGQRNTKHKCSRNSKLLSLLLLDFVTPSCSLVGPLCMEKNNTIHLELKSQILEFP